MQRPGDLHAVSRSTACQASSEAPVNATSPTTAAFAAAIGLTIGITRETASQATAIMRPVEGRPPRRQHGLDNMNHAHEG